MLFTKRSGVEQGEINGPFLMSKMCIPTPEGGSHLSRAMLVEDTG